MFEFLNYLGSANSTAKGELCSFIAILWMADTKRAFLWVFSSTSWSFWDSSVWSVMAWFAVMSCTEAEEQCNVAAVLALVVDVVGSVDITALNSGTNHLCRTLSTDEIFLLDVGFICSSAVDESSEVWLCASEARVECAFEHCKFLIFLIKVVMRVFQAWIFVKSLSLSHLNCHLLDLFFDLSSLTKGICKLWAVVNVNLLVACWAFKELESDSVSKPFVLD